MSQRAGLSPLPAVGACGEGLFDNDDASDLVGDLSEQPPAAARLALGAVLVGSLSISGSGVGRHFRRRDGSWRKTR